MKLKGGFWLFLLCALLLDACNLPSQAANDLIAPVAVMTSGTECRIGPGPQDGSVAGLTPGQSAEIAGRTADGRSLLVRAPQDPGILCWVQADVTTIVGDLSNAPLLDVKPVSTDANACPSPVGGGPTPPSCSDPVGSGCPSPVGGGPAPVSCSGVAVIGCPSPIGGGPTPVDCSGSGGAPAVIGCPSPIGGGPTPVDCSGQGGSPQSFGPPTLIPSAKRRTLPTPVGLPAPRSLPTLVP